MNRLAKKPYFTRVAIIISVFLVLLAALIRNLVKVQLVDNEKYKDKAFLQYTTELSINPKRGTIYDRNMKALAVSATVENIIVAPREIEEEMIEPIAQFLSQTLELDKDTVLAKLKKRDSMYQIIKKQVEKETADKIRVFMSENNLSNGIHFEDNTKRYYPDGNFASHVLGFTNSDNVGAYGIEAKYENYLKGVPGKVITAQNAKVKDMPFEYESYIGAENGTNLVLTIDWSIQYFLEKNLEAALEDTNAQNRVFGIVMDVNTAEILAIATKPDFDPNDPYTLDARSQKKLDEFQGTEEEKKTYYKELLEELWKNKAVTEIYEPGSTFKLVTSAIALEENLVKAGDGFYCPGHKTVAGKVIHCHKVSGHGSETFAQGLQNSCNPVFMTLAERIGKYKFYEYFKAFGMTERTNIDLPGEASSIYHTDIKGFNDVELAVYSFGQTFKVTPLQLMRAASAVANGGYLLQPHIVKELVDDDGNVIESYDTKVVRQVISENTSKQIMQILADGINVGSTKNAYVKGYSVAAKTGTSQKRDKVNPKTGEKDLMIGSCIAFAPANDPQIAVLIAIDEPSNGQYYGGVIAAPVVSAVLTDVLPYLNIPPELTDAEKESMGVCVSNYRNTTVADAKTKIEKDKLNYKVIGDGEVVIEQFPRDGTYVSSGGIVVLYTGSSVPQSNVTVPNVMNLSPSEANRKIINSGLNIKMNGTYQEGIGGAVSVSQLPEAGEKVQPGTVVTVTFKHLDGTD